MVCAALGNGHLILFFNYKLNKKKSCSLSKQTLWGTKGKGKEGKKGGEKGRTEIHAFWCINTNGLQPYIGFLYTKVLSPKGTGDKCSHPDH